MTSPADKSALRRHFLAQRLAIAPEHYIRWSNACCARLCEIMGMFPACRAVAGYMPVKGEMDILPALLQLHIRGIALAMPVIASDALQFCTWKPLDAMEHGSFGIPHPRPLAPPLIPDVLIVPLLAFNRAGHRLGYGKGYYDRALAALRKGNSKLLAIGAAFSLQETDTLPAEAHDEPLDRIVTEKEIITP